MQDNRRNYYRILHVQQDAPAEIIRSSYRTLMQKLRYHPDLGGDEWNASLLNEAWAVLSDERKRAAYDAANGFGAAGRGQAEASAGNEQEAAGTPSHERDPYVPEEEPLVPRVNPYDADFLESCFFCGMDGRGMPVCAHCDSPLQPPPPMGSPSTDQRALERLAIKASVRVYVRWPQAQGFPGMIRNFTPHGMQIKLRSSLEPNQVIKITSQVIVSVSRVASCIEDHQRGGYNIGLEFLSLCFNKPRGGFVSERA